MRTVDGHLCRVCGATYTEAEWLALPGGSEPWVPVDGSDLEAGPVPGTHVRLTMRHCSAPGCSGTMGAEEFGFPRHPSCEVGDDGACDGCAHGGPCERLGRTCEDCGELISQTDVDLLGVAARVCEGCYLLRMALE